MQDIIVIGASAGGVEELIKLSSRLPEGLPASIFVVVHVSAGSPGLLPKILQRHSPLKIQFPGENEEIVPGCMYIAPPDHHILLSPQGVHLSHGVKINRLRPSIDVLFCSAARAFGPRVIGIVLSGTGSDGSLGLQTIHEHGGITVVQDPEEAVFSGMPSNALHKIPVDYVLKSHEIAGLIERLPHLPKTVPSQSHRAIPEKTAGKVEKTMHKRFKRDSKNLEKDKLDFEQEGKDDTPRTLITCPECGGVVWEVKQGNLAHYECQIGHTFSESSLIDGQGERLEEALWIAIRALDERQSMTTRLAHRAAQQGHSLSEKQFLRQAEEAKENASLIRSIVTRTRATSPVDNTGDE